MSKSVTSKIIRFIAFTVGLGVFASALGAIGVLIGGRGLGEFSFGALGLAILGLLAFYIVGIVLGLFLIRKLFHQPGSIWLGVLGGIIATVIFGIAAFAGDTEPTLFFTLLGTGVPAGAMAGFYLKR